MLNEIYFARQNHKYTSETRCIFAMSAKCTCSRINVMIAFASERECTLNGWIVKITPGFPIRVWIGAIASEISKRIIRLTNAMYKLHTLYAFHFAIRQPDRNNIKCCAHSVLHTLNNVDNFTSGQLFCCFCWFCCHFHALVVLVRPFHFPYVRNDLISVVAIFHSGISEQKSLSLRHTHEGEWVSERVMEVEVKEKHDRENKETPTTENTLK